MDQKDLTEKILEDYNDVFADIINGLIFDGKQVITPQSLDHASVHSQYKADDTKIHEQERDVAKYWNGPNRIRFAVLGIENQTKVDRFMPVRMFGYDGASYRSQLHDRSTDIVPVVTIVLHFGTEKPWSAPTSLKELMNIPNGMEDFANDYKIHVFDIAWLTDEQIAKFCSDFRIVANFFQKKRTCKDYIPDDLTEFTHVDEVLKLLSVMTNDQEYANLIRTDEDRKELKNMCDVANRIKANGRKEGILEGREEGLMEGKILTYAEIVRNNELPLQTVLNRLNMNEEEFWKTIEQLEKKNK